LAVFLGEQLAGGLTTVPPDTYTLSNTPEVDTIVVTEDGVERTAGWSFDTALNAIVFDSASVPEAGGALEVQYRLQIVCPD
jgi:hypothetical protein